MLNWILFAGIGKLLIYLFMKFPLPAKIKKINFIKELHECDLCTGVWIYVILAFFFKIDLPTIWFEMFYVPVVSEVITGSITSYLIHLLSIGFREKHLNVIVV